MHTQKQQGLNWIGVVLPVARLTTEQMRGLARIAHQLGDGDIRLTVWQNLLISGVADREVSAAEAAIESLGLTTKATSIRVVLGRLHRQCRVPLFGFRYQAPRGKDILALPCEALVDLDCRRNPHPTGCHHKCA